jgi:acetylornithine deacetylase/succinyl-diaminopimelate desuccinylase-like protein
MKRFSSLLLATVFAYSASLLLVSTVRAEVDWKVTDPEILKHFQALVRMDTADPPGNEQPTADYLVKALKDGGVDVQTFAKKEGRPNVVARIKGNGKKKPLLILGHQDVVNVDAAKWKFPPFSATRDGGWIYGRGTVDDKDNVTAGLMVMLLLKREKVALDRDVIFLSEVGEEGSTQFGIAYMIEEHFKEIDAEYCFAEGGNSLRMDGKMKYAAVQTTEKVPRAINVTATGFSGHGSVPLESNAIAHLSKAVAAIAEWQSPIRLNETTLSYFQRMAEISTPEEAARYRAVLKPGTKEADEAFAWLRKNQPSQASMLHTSVSPNMFTAGYRVNVIPSEAKATLDVRVIPQEDPELTLTALKKLVDDPAVNIEWAPRANRPGANSRLDTEAFRVIEATYKKHYDAPVLPIMATGGTDMAYLRPKGMQCYGSSVAVDGEDLPKGFGMHSDQERVLESELYRFVHAQYDVISTLARSK